MAELTYFLAESVVTVTGSIEYTTDEFGNGEVRSNDPSNATVTLGVRGDEGGGLRSLTLDRKGASDDMAVALTEDGRLSTVTYKSTGSGGRVVAGGAKILAFVGGIAARALMMASPAPAPETAARTQWERNNAALTDQRKRYAQLVDELSTSVLTARENAAKASTPLEMQTELIRARRLEELLAVARGELERIQTIYRAWRASTITSRTVTITHTAAVNALAHSPSGGTPDPGALDGIAKTIWDDLGIIVQVEPLYGRSHHTGHLPPMADAPTEARFVRWRVPRPARITIWRRGSNNRPTLERSTPEMIVDATSSTAAFELTATFFGEHSSELTFAALGQPTKLAAVSGDGAAAFADALAGLPDAVAGGLKSATEATESFGGLLDAESKRRLDAKKRELEMLQTEISLKGTQATAEDATMLKRLEQQVAIADAEGKVSTTSMDAAAAEAELRLVKAQTDLHKATRDNELELELGALRSEVARLQEQIALDKLQHPQ